MVLKYENNLLTSSEPLVIRSADNIIRLTSDIDATFLGVVTLSDRSVEVIEFVKNNDVYLGRLIIGEDDIGLLDKARIHLQVSNASFSSTTNMLELLSDVTSIKTDIKVKISNEYKTLIERINELEEKIKYPASKFLDNINIVNKDVIKAGMIPVALDDKTFVALYPFTDHVKSVNGQTAADGAVTIDSSMIKYKTGKTVEVTIQDIVDAIVAVNTTVKAVSNEIKEIRTQLNEIDDRLTRHINDGII